MKGQTAYLKIVSPPDRSNEASGFKKRKKQKKKKLLLAIYIGSIFHIPVNMIDDRRSTCQKALCDTKFSELPLKWNLNEVSPKSRGRNLYGVQTEYGVQNWKSGDGDTLRGSMKLGLSQTTAHDQQPPNERYESVSNVPSLVTLMEHSLITVVH